MKRGCWRRCRGRWDSRTRLSLPVCISLTVTIFANLYSPIASRQRGVGKKKRDLCCGTWCNPLPRSARYAYRTVTQQGPSTGVNYFFDNTFHCLCIQKNTHTLYKFQTWRFVSITCHTSTRQISLYQSSPVVLKQRGAPPLGRRW